MRMLVAIVLFLAGAAHAATIEYRFAGTVGDVVDFNHTLNVQVGDPFAVRFIFDPNTPDLADNNARIGEYQAISAALTLPHLSMNVPGELWVHDNLGADDYTFAANWGILGADRFQVQAQDDTSTLLTSDALLSIAQVQSFGEAIFAFNSGDVGGGKFAGFATLVPEPSSLFVVMLGFALTIRRR